MNDNCCEKKINGEDTNLQNDLQLGNFATDTQRLLVPDGSVTRPSIGFIGTPTSGLYTNGVGDITLTCSGVNTAFFGTSFITPYFPILAQKGSVNAPTYSYNSDPNTGIYNIAADNLGIACNGVKQVDISTSNFTTTNPVLGANGSVSLPSYSFSGDTDTGIYRIGANNLGVSLNGVKTIDCTTAFVSSPVPMMGKSYYFSSINPTTQSVANSTVTAIQYLNAGITSNGTFTFSGSNNNTFTVPINGLYQLTASISISSNATGLRQSYWTRTSTPADNVDYGRFIIAPLSGSTTGWTMSAVLPIQTTDTIQLNINHSGGTALLVPSTTQPNSFSCVLISLL